MNKRAARQWVDTKPITFGELRKMVLAWQGPKDRQSRVNPAITMHLAASTFLAAIKNRADEETVEAKRYSAGRDRMVNTQDALIAENILREFA